MAIPAPTLHHLRRRLGLTQAELAYELGVSLATIQRMESSDAPVSRQRLYLLATWAVLKQMER